MHKCRGTKYFKLKTHQNCWKIAALLTVEKFMIHMHWSQIGSSFKTALGTAETTTSLAGKSPA